MENNLHAKLEKNWSKNTKVANKGRWGLCLAFDCKGHVTSHSRWAVSYLTQWKESFSRHLWFAFVVVFLAEMGRIPCCGRAESSSSNIWYEKPFWCVKLCAWSHTKCVSLLALGFTHHKGFSYQIIELEDSGLPQQGILPISAKKE